jgi:hypothetical protein
VNTYPFAKTQQCIHPILNKNKNKTKSMHSSVVGCWESFFLSHGVCCISDCVKPIWGRNTTHYSFMHCMCLFGFRNFQRLVLL